MGRLSRAVAIGSIALDLVAIAQPAQAAQITVNDLGDDILTAPNDGDCTLREAIDAANTNTAEDECPAGSPGPDTIILPAGTITLSVLGSDEDANLDGDLDITESATIVGAGARATVVEIKWTGYFRNSSRSTASSP